MQEAFFVLPQTLQTRFDVEISLIFHIIGKLSRQENKMVWRRVRKGRGIAI